tara:strand:+ start:1471 stop:1638 length:168 start_codon:yes stop_codon:yes gene_type:complete
MKIDTSTIKEVMLSIDDDAQKDPEFEHEVDMFIFQLTRFQKEKNAKRKKKQKRNS